MNTFHRSTHLPTRLATRLHVRSLAWLLALVVALVHAPSASAQHRPRISHDIADRLRTGDGSTTRVIVTGSRARVEAVAARHGLRVRKWLQNGAALEVPAGLLERVADDPDVDQVSGDLPVQAHMA